jgi:hypothetical protein
VNRGRDKKYDGRPFQEENASGPMGQKGWDSYGKQVLGRKGEKYPQVHAGGDGADQGAVAGPGALGDGRPMAGPEGPTKAPAPANPDNAHPDPQPNQTVLHHHREGNRMDRDELIQFLKENLTIAIETGSRHLGTGSRETTVTIRIAGEDVCSDHFHHD